MFLLINIKVLEDNCSRRNIGIRPILMTYEGQYRCRYENHMATANERVNFEGGLI